MLLPLPAGFDAVTLTESIDLMKPSESWVGDQNLFPFEGLDTTIAAIQRTNDGICLVPSGEYCVPPAVVNRRDRVNDIVMIRIPATSLRSALHVCDFAGRMKWDLTQERGLINFADEIAKEQADMRSKLDHTLEYRRTRALFGEVLDANGALLVDMFERFNYAPLSMAMNLNDPNFSVRGFAVKLIRAIKDCYRGAISGITVMLPRDDFDALIEHPRVYDIYKRCCDTAGNLLKNMDEEGFTIAGVTFRPVHYHSCYYDAAGVRQDVDFFAPPTNPATGVAYTQPVGIAYATSAAGNYTTYGAPLPHVDFVNRKADREFYSTIEPLCHGMGFEMMAYMNLLPVVKQPCANVRVIVTR